MSILQTGAYDRFVLEQKYAKIWSQHLPIRALKRVRNLSIFGAQLSNCWSEHALLFVSEKQRMCRLVAHAKRSVEAICTCAPEYLENIADSDIIDINEDLAQQLLQQPPQPTSAFRLNWRHRTSAVFSTRFEQLQLRVLSFNKVFMRCHRRFARHINPDIQFNLPWPEWTRRVPAFHGQRVQWKMSTIFEWTHHQLGLPTVIHTPEILYQVNAVRTALLAVREGLRDLAHAVEVFIYLEWRALARVRTVSIVRRITDQIAQDHPLYIHSNLAVPDALAALVVAMLVG